MMPFRCLADVLGNSDAPMSLRPAPVSFDGWSFTTAAAGIILFPPGGRTEGEVTVLERHPLVSPGTLLGERLPVETAVTNEGEYAFLARHEISSLGVVIGDGWCTRIDGVARTPRLRAEIDDAVRMLVAHASLGLGERRRRWYLYRPPSGFHSAHLYGLLQRLAASDLPVLIQGETGVGKEAAATFVHAGSSRSGRPFLALNCATVPENLAESELFGYDKGAFSGAASAKPGLLESASGGTIFLDEVGELSLAVQAKLLRVVESRKVMRLGEVRERPIDIRIVAATNRDLEEEARVGRFRQDLFFRLSTALVRIPPLRERPRELLLLARKFLEEAAERMSRPSLRLEDSAVAALLRYRWPGNVRELRNIIDFTVASVVDDVIDVQHLPPRILAESAADPIASPPDAARGLTVQDEVRELEKRRMIEALASCDGNQSRAAALIGMPRRTFVAKLKQYRIRRGPE